MVSRGSMCRSYRAPFPAGQGAAPSAAEGARREGGVDAPRIRTTAAAARPGCLVLVALGLIACASPPAADVAGRYRHEGPVGATLEVRREADEYAVRLEGGGSDAGAATAADCIIEARGGLDGTVLHAGFGPVETDTFSYSAAQAASEGRTVAIAFEPGAAVVREADTFGYCGLEATLVGRYQRASEQHPMRRHRQRASLVGMTLLCRNEGATR